jgi:acyl carrier protein
MTLDEFTIAVQELFDNDSIVLTTETDFRDNDEFDSLIGMSILVMIKDNFNYSMSVNEFLSCNTPADLFNTIQKNNA